MDLTNLRNKTIFDFTDDPEIIGELVSTLDEEIFLKGLTPEGRALSLVDYAEYIHDDELKKAVEKEFGAELTLFFNE
ncbi:MAG: hypothetical protein KBG17_07820 [Paludibacteraceae bacterium]|nr:hypothetical protein [Paludibacteraceae bacterium]